MYGARETGDSIKPGAQAPGSGAKKLYGARETGDSRIAVRLSPVSQALLIFNFANLGLAPQALCCRSLRELYFTAS